MSKASFHMNLVAQSMLWIYSRSVHGCSGEAFCPWGSSGTNRRRSSGSDGRMVKRRKFECMMLSCGGNHRLEPLILMRDQTMTDFFPPSNGHGFSFALIWRACMREATTYQFHPHAKKRFYLRRKFYFTFKQKDHINVVRDFCFDPDVSHPTKLQRKQA